MKRRRSGIKYADSIRCNGIGYSLLRKGECAGYDTKLHLMVRLQFGWSKGCGVTTSLLLLLFWPLVGVLVRVPSILKQISLKMIRIRQKFFMSFNSKLFVLKIVTWSYYCLLKSILVAWNHITMCIQMTIIK